ncbi:hypothetical protein HK104_001959 [Borealophlyctis nickersoniae]|nr:hypothetical protein HK104_001959 [Borealophlyctis nickersoniae]
MNQNQLKRKRDGSNLLGFLEIGGGGRSGTGRESGRDAEGGNGSGRMLGRRMEEGERNDDDDEYDDTYFTQRYPKRPRQALAASTATQSHTRTRPTNPTTSRCPTSHSHLPHTPVRLAMAPFAEATYAREMQGKEAEIAQLQRQLRVSERRRRGGR